MRTNASTRRITVDLSPEMYADLKALAAHDRAAMSVVVRRALDMHLIVAMFTGYQPASERQFGDCGQPNAEAQQKTASRASNG